jgi:hypothetical protein
MLVQGKDFVYHCNSSSRILIPASIFKTSERTSSTGRGGIGLKNCLINVISNCPDDYFTTHKRFYYLAFHSTIFLDYYLTIPPSDFSPMLSFTQTENKDRPEEAIDDLIPDKIYDKREIVAYLKQSREKGKQIIYALNNEKLNNRFKEGDHPNDMNYPILEILLYNMRHTQHHAGQLNMLLRQDINKHIEWSFRAGDIDIE